MLNGMLDRVLDCKDCQYRRSSDGMGRVFLGKKSILHFLGNAR